ncbi:piggyBac transposable element-derived protein 4 [Biomphalaria glabrata]|nr:piggyBac transposable element-derived protein 4 [Biomphalaria glabrata]
MMCSNFQKAFYPFEEVAIDEMVIGFKDLLEYLTQKRFYYTGTVNLARKNFPAELKKQKLRHRETQFYKSVGIIDALCVAWQDKKAKKPCSMVSKKSTNRIINVQQKRSVVEKPEMVHDYNMMMNGCDRAELLLSYYSVHSRKSMKWWKKVFFWILEIADMNALIIYNATQITCDQPLKKYKETLITGLVDAATALGDVPRQVKVKTVKADKQNSTWASSCSL